MNDYVSRSELPPVDRVVSRAPSPVQAMQSGAASRSAQAPVRERASAQQSSAPQVDTVVVDDDLASVAEYVEVHARVADILADLQSGVGSVDDAAGAIQAMIPRPMVLVPLPPASKEAVEHAAVLAKRIVERASYSHAAHAQISRGTVEQVAISTN
ncbi:hypothetical protein ASE85_11695 [Sphingobium sp. Leaf26]|uniref:hypothetical protein n=1 Tax=Sphingobium sp. Leaf26 TaxID=1735693 RepID=UPI0006F89608|nr:hypothetical protein [Sphingobium sp. Leaf26]KQM98511.1 hypothetical protein ASE85_11695 [Sphingobium sp. Leaf26]